MGIICYREEINTGETRIPRNLLKIINNLIEKCLCKIINYGDEKGKIGRGTSFFCKIPFPDSFHLLPVLIKNNHVLDDNHIRLNKYIQFQLGDSENIHKILIDNKRKTYTNKNFDTTIIEILENDGLDKESFLETQPFNMNENIEKTLKNKKTYIIHYPLGGKSEISFGSILSINKKDNDFKHNNPTDTGSSGCPILDSDNHKVFGIHKSSYKFANYNLGTLIEGPIKEFYQKQKII